MHAVLRMHARVYVQKHTHHHLSLVGFFVCSTTEEIAKKNNQTKKKKKRKKKKWTKNASARGEREGLIRDRLMTQRRKAKIRTINHKKNKNH